MTLRSAAVAVLIGASAFQTVQLRAAELKDETKLAWSQYLSHETQAVAKRSSSAKFLWADETPSRIQELHDGKILAEPVTKSGPLHVPSGLIHHWIGAIYIPNTSVADVMSITRDYGHYKDYYKPGVSEARTITSSPAEDEFVIRFVNSSMLSRSTLEGSYRSDFVQLNGGRWYSVCATSHVQEIRDAGEPGEKRYAPDTGSGYIWRLYSTARVEERDGGVVLEMEAIALSREIPGAVRWIVDPIVRRVSRESLEKSLSETAEAARNHAEACADKAAHEKYGPSQISIAGTCPRHNGTNRADTSDFRDQRLSASSGR